MRLSPIFALVAVLLLAFAYWGLATAAGRHAYDEMDGMIPMGAGVLGLILLPVSALFAVFRR